MATGTGSATLTFSDSTRTALTKARKVVTDSVPTPHQMEIRRLNTTPNARNKLAYSNGVFVSVPQGTNQDVSVYYPDGTFTTSTIGSAQAWQLGGDEIGTNGFLVIAPAIGTHRISTDGVGWGFRSSAWAAVTYCDPVFGNGKWVTVINGAGTDHATISADGNTVTLYNNLTLKTYGGVIFDGNYFIAWTSNQTYRSSDGITWGNSSTLTNYNSQSMYTNRAGTTIALSANVATDYFYRSTDGFANFDTIFTPFTFPTIKKAVYGEGYWYFYGTTHNRVWITADFVNWEERALLPWTDDWMWVYGGGSFIAVSRTAANSPLYAYSKGGRFFDDNVRTITTEYDTIEGPLVSPGSSEASVAITGLTSFQATDHVEAWIQGTDSTADHSAMEHAMAPVRLRVTDPISGQGFTIRATANQRLTGSFKVRYVFAS